MDKVTPRTLRQAVEEAVILAVVEEITRPENLSLIRKRAGEAIRVGVRIFDGYVNRRRDKPRFIEVERVSFTREHVIVNRKYRFDRAAWVDIARDATAYSALQA